MGRFRGPEAPAIYHPIPHDTDSSLSFGPNPLLLELSYMYHHDADTAKTKDPMVAAGTADIYEYAPESVACLACADIASWFTNNAAHADCQCHVNQMDTS